MRETKRRKLTTAIVKESLHHNDSKSKIASDTETDTESEYSDTEPEYEETSTPETTKKKQLESEEKTPEVVHIEPSVTRRLPFDIPKNINKTCVGREARPFEQPFIKVPARYGQGYYYYCAMVKNKNIKRLRDTFMKKLAANEISLQPPDRFKISGEILYINQAGFALWQTLAQTLLQNVTYYEAELQEVIPVSLPFFEKEKVKENVHPLPQTEIPSSHEEIPSFMNDLISFDDSDLNMLQTHSAAFNVLSERSNELMYKPIVQSLFQTLPPIEKCSNEMNSFDVDSSTMQAIKRLFLTLNIESDSVGLVFVDDTILIEKSKYKFFYQDLLMILQHDISVVDAIKEIAAEKQLINDSTYGPMIELLIDQFKAKGDEAQKKSQLYNLYRSLPELVVSREKSKKSIRFENKEHYDVVNKFFDNFPRTRGHKSLEKFGIKARDTTHCTLILIKPDDLRYQEFTKFLNNLVNRYNFAIFDKTSAEKPTVQPNIKFL